LHVPNSSRIAHGETVNAGEVMARSKGMFGLMKTDVKAAATGTIESVSDSSGMVFLRGAPQSIEIMAHVPGRVVEVLASEGAVIETSAALVQGIFGVGGEAPVTTFACM
jgi:biotin carboxyl carrier protein